MTCKAHPIRMAQHIAAFLLAVVSLVGCRAPNATTSETFVRYGSMHEAVGQRIDHGRIGLAEVVKRPHFYGVGALEGLAGEITIQDSVATVTGVTPDGWPKALPPTGMQATMLAGESVEAWTSQTLDKAVSPRQFDEAIASAASRAGIDDATPFIFTIEGEFTNVRLHIIHGACPLHARMKKLELPPSERPFELEAKTLAGTLVGVYATDSVGKLTHPATTTHAHIIYVDQETGQRVTGHLEHVGLAPGAVLKLPMPDETRVASAQR